jgi:hypothetical protein
VDYQFPTFSVDLSIMGITSPTGLDAMLWDLLGAGQDLVKLFWSACDDNGWCWTSDQANTTHAGRLCSCRKCRMGCDDELTQYSTLI